MHKNVIQITELGYITLDKDNIPNSLKDNETFGGVEAQAKISEFKASEKLINDTADTELAGITKYPSAVSLLLENISSNETRSVKPALDYWARTQIIDTTGGANVEVPAGNGIYITTGIKNPSNLKNVLSALNKMGDGWIIENRRFVKV